MAQNIGNESLTADENHPSISMISLNIKPNQCFTFNPVSEDFVGKQIGKLNTKKAVGIDGISSKLLKAAQPVLTGPLTVIINSSISYSTFPDKLKIAQVKPLHKKIVI